MAIFGWSIVTRKVKTGQQFWYAVLRRKQIARDKRLVLKYRHCVTVNLFILVNVDNDANLICIYSRAMKFTINP